jgi:hypothetical protein
MASKQELQALAVAKERLIREGELYRLSTLRSKHEVIHAMQPQALLHSAVEQGIGALQARLGGLIGEGGGLSSLNFKSLLPYALPLVSWIARKRMWKPAAAAGVLAAIGGWWLMRHKPDA